MGSLMVRYSYSSSHKDGVGSDLSVHSMKQL